jgi:hypothetical protein
VQYAVIEEMEKQTCQKMRSLASILKRFTKTGRVAVRRLKIAQASTTGRGVEL